MLVGSDGDAYISSIDVYGLEQEVAGPSFKHRFKRILKANNEETWWNAIESVLREDCNFAERVSRTPDSLTLTCPIYRPLGPVY